MHLVMAAYDIGKMLLLYAVNHKWLKVDERAEEYRDSHENSEAKEALLDFAA